MNTKDLTRLGVPSGAPLKLGMEFIMNFIARGGDPSRLGQCLQQQFEPLRFQLCP